MDSASGAGGGDGSPTVDANTASMVGLRLARPWARFWSRSLDVSLGGLLVGMLSGLLWPGLLYDSLALRWISLPLVFVLDGLVYRAFGTTPGRALVGIEVRNLDYERLPLGIYLRRDAWVWLIGFGTGFPLIALITMAAAYERVADGDQTSWDQKFGSRVFAIGHDRARMWMAAAAVVFLQGAAIGILLLSMGQPSTAPPINTGTAEARLERIADALNKARVTDQKVGSVLGSDLIFDGVQADDGRVFIYRYKLASRAKEDLDLASAERAIGEALRPDFVARLCSGEPRELKMLAAEVQYQVLDRYGRRISVIRLERRDCP
jgi:hypothetical protein